MDPIKIGWLGACARRSRRRLRQDPPAWPSTRPSSRDCWTGRTSSCCTARTGCRTASAKNATDGFRYLVDEGCIGVAGAYSSDNAITVAPLANELRGAADQLGGHRAAAGRVLLPARQRRRRWRRRARRGVAEAAGPPTHRGAERDLTERRGVLPVLPSGVPSARPHASPRSRR